MTSKRRKKHKPEQIVAKLRDADATLNAGKNLAAVLQALEISEATLHRCRAGHRRAAGFFGRRTRGNRMVNRPLAKHSCSTWETQTQEPEV